MVAIPVISSTLISEIIIVAIIAIVIFVIFKMGKTILKLIFGIITNSILGLIALYLLNYLFSLGIPIHIYTLIVVGLFGLPAVGTLVILKFFGALITVVV